MFPCACTQSDSSWFQVSKPNKAALVPRFAADFVFARFESRFLSITANSSGCASIPKLPENVVTRQKSTPEPRPGLQ
jgi:hypothetical protein